MMEAIPPVESSDAALSVAWAAGDERAFEQIVARHAKRIYNRCRMSLGTADADDATQAVFLVLARKGGQAAASPVLAAWLMQVASNVISNALRDRGRRRNAESQAPPPLPVEEPAMPDLAAHLESCLAELPAAEREAVSLHHLAGCTLAEVAAHTGSGISTVHARVQRGVERLRAAFARRGVVVGSSVLLACLHAEAQAAVPEAVLVHLRVRASVHSGGGSTASPERALRWSLQKRNIMSRIAIAGAVVLLTAGILHQRFSTMATSAEPSALPPASATVDGGTQADVTPTRIDPERARIYLVACIDDVPTALARFHQQPEAQLIPSKQATILADLSGVRRARCIIEPFSNLSRNRQIAYLRKLAADGSHEQGPPGAAQAEDNVGQPSFRADIAYLDGRESAAVSTLIRTWVEAQPQAIRSMLRTENAPGQVTIAYDAAHGDAAGIASVLAGAPGGADLNLAMVIDPGVPDCKPEAFLTVAMTMGPSGAHLVWNGLAVDQAMPAPSPACDRLKLEQVPRQALAATVVRLGRGTTFAGLRSALAAPSQGDSPQGGKNQVRVNLTLNGLAGSLRFVDPVQQASAAAAATVLDRLDGDALIWLQPGMPFPALCAEIPMTESDALELIASRAVGDADAFTFTHEELAIHGCWRNGHLLLTTDPAGSAAFLPAGGFCENPEVRSALAAMPNQPAPFALVMRSGACLDQALPLLNMVLPSEQRTMLSAYREAVRSEHGHGWLVGGMRIGGRSQSEAGGILALGAVGAIVALSLDPGQFIGAAN